MQYIFRLSTILVIVLLIAGCDDDKDPVSSKVAEERADVIVFQAAGPAGARGLLAEGATYPPTAGGFSILQRGADLISYKLETTGLPPGAYTNWWIIFNNPAGCIDGCDADDIFSPDTKAQPAVFWSTGGVVEANGVGNFEAEIREGQASKGPDGFLLGNGLTDAANAEVHIAIKYHGPASSDPDELFAQTHTVIGLCDDRANGYSDGNCFDPQAVIHGK